MSQPLTLPSVSTALRKFDNRGLSYTGKERYFSGGAKRSQLCIKSHLWCHMSRIGKSVRLAAGANPFGSSSSAASQSAFPALGQPQPARQPFSLGFGHTSAPAGPFGQAASSATAAAPFGQPSTSTPASSPWPAASSASNIASGFGAFGFGTIQSSECDVQQSYCLPSMQMLVLQAQLTSLQRHCISAFKTESSCMHINIVRCIFRNS